MLVDLHFMMQMRNGKPGKTFLLGVDPKKNFNQNYKKQTFQNI